MRLRCINKEKSKHYLSVLSAILAGKGSKKPTAPVYLLTFIDLFNEALC